MERIEDIFGKWDYFVGEVGKGDSNKGCHIV